MPRWLYALILSGPAALAARLLSWPPLVIFILSAISLIPLAALVGRATEALARRLGPRLGGLLNATFGNAAELIITCLAIRQGLLTLVRASLTGSIIGNLLLVLGTGLVAGGLRHGVQQFDSRPTSRDATMLALAVAGLYLPAIFAASVPEQDRIEAISLVVAGTLLLTYAAYIAFTIFLRPASQGWGEESDDEHPQAREADAGDEEAHEQGRWGTRKALAVLGGAVGGTAVVSELLVDAVGPVTQQIGLSELFMGVVIIPIAGNAAEHFSAVQQAWRNKLDITLPISAGSSTQIALLVAPVLVFISLALGHPLTLIFTPLELGVLALATVIFALISFDGRANWLEGVQLLALYLVAACTFFFWPH